MLLPALTQDGGCAADDAGNGAGEADPEANDFMVGPDGGGRWVVRDRRGLNAGIFSSYGPALHFAKQEAEAAHSAVILSAIPIKLGVEL